MSLRAFLHVMQFGYGQDIAKVLGEKKGGAGGDATSGTARLSTL
jgi:hypothetical protein